MPDVKGRIENLFKRVPERNGIAEEERMDDDNGNDENEKVLWAYKKMS